MDLDYLYYGTGIAITGYIGYSIIINNIENIIWNYYKLETIIENLYETLISKPVNHNHLTFYKNSQKIEEVEYVEYIKNLCDYNIRIYDYDVITYEIDGMKKIFYDKNDINDTFTKSNMKFLSISITQDGKDIPIEFPDELYIKNNKVLGKQFLKWIKVEMHYHKHYVLNICYQSTPTSGIEFMTLEGDQNIDPYIILE